VPLASLATRLAAQSAATGAAPDSSVVAGVVRARGGALAGAEVVVTPKLATPGIALARRQFTNDDGTFRLTGLPPSGEATLTVRRIGYRPVTRSLALPSGAALTVELEQLPQQIAAVVVNERKRGPYTGWLRDFNRRRDAGFGRFISRADIDRTNPTRTTELLRMVPGLQLYSTNTGSSIRIRNAPCPPLIVVDGAPALSGYLDVDIFSPQTLDGIEVYSGAATVPAELRTARGDDRCGVIALWSRMPAARPRGRKQVTAEDLARLVESATVYTVEQVDEPVQADSARPVSPAYPEALRRTRVEGEALVEFVVDTAGHVELETLSVVSATHAAFGAAARDAVLTATFLPARKAGRVVRQVVLLPVRFEGRK
jgi:TonB family protein